MARYDTNVASEMEHLGTLTTLSLPGTYLSAHLGLNFPAHTYPHSTLAAVGVYEVIGD